MKASSRRRLGTGLSPWSKYHKREYLYSPAYQAWAEQYRPRKASQKTVSHIKRDLALAA